MTTIIPVARRPEQRTRIARAAALLLAATFAGLTACSAGSGTEPRANPDPDPNQSSGGPRAGVHVLQAIDRADLPATIYRGPATDSKTGRTYTDVLVVISAGSVEFVSATQFAMVFNLTITADGLGNKTSRYIDGTYERNGPVLKFHPKNGLATDFGGALGDGVISIHFDLIGAGSENYYTFE
jgi:hypothetical protein